MKKGKAQRTCCSVHRSTVEDMNLPCWSWTHRLFGKSIQQLLKTLGVPESKLRALRALRELTEAEEKTQNGGPKDLRAHREERWVNVPLSHDPEMFWDERGKTSVRGESQQKTLADPPVPTEVRLAEIPWGQQTPVLLSVVSCKPCGQIWCQSHCVERGIFYLRICAN